MSNEEQKVLDLYKVIKETPGELVGRDSAIIRLKAFLYSMSKTVYERKGVQTYWKSVEKVFDRMAVQNPELLV